MFREARLKLKRANKHIRDLDAMVEAFCTRCQYGLYVEGYSETGDVLAKIGLVDPAPVPEEISLVLGDAIHNIRTALDHAWFEITNADTPEKLRWKNNFPCLRDEEAFEIFLKQREQQQSVIPIAKVLLDEIQPYIGGNGASLRYLDRLDIIDKHKLLVAHSHLSLAHHIWIEDEKGKRHKIRPRIFNGDLRFAVPGAKRLKFVENSVLGSTISFADTVEGVADEPIVPTLRLFNVQVERVLTILG
jgi:hypothetical protein